MIPVNLITGFLGVGKTTLISHLLSQVPSSERWAVLVNEFGEAGVDGSLLQQQDIAIEEVAGGCLCCVAAPAFTVGLNRLIRQHKPSHILIEPSGLGHPAKIIEQLHSPLYAQVLSLHATLTLIDARHLSSARHREHPTFIDQIHLADILVANKADQYTADDEQALLDFVKTLQPPKQAVLLAEHGEIDPQVLDLGNQERQAAFPEAHAFLLQQQAATPPPPAADWLKRQQQQDGYHTLAWLIDNNYTFKAEALLAWLNTLDCERLKASANCGDRQLLYNRSAPDPATVAWRPTTSHTRIQLIHPTALPAEAIEQQLRGLLAPVADELH